MTIPPEILDRLVSIRASQVDGITWITVERRDIDRQGGFRWVVCLLGDRLSKSKTWDHPPLPSHRPDGWNEAHQWATFAEAWEAAMAAKMD